FTGSTEIGRSVYERAARRGIRAQCEMGGKNPVVVLEDADVDLAVAGVSAGAFGSTGPPRTRPSRLVLLRPGDAAFLESVVGIAGKMQLGDPLADGIDMGPSVDDSQLQTVL